MDRRSYPMLSIPIVPITPRYPQQLMPADPTSVEMELPASGKPRRRRQSRRFIRRILR
jgi:hypothetical protein